MAGCIDATGDDHGLCLTRSVRVRYWRTIVFGLNGEEVQT